MANLARQKNELAKTAAPSSLDLVLAKSLDTVSQIYKTELMPGEVRVWQSSLAEERPETVVWAFAEYVKTGKFPPKPADIMEIIREHKECVLHEFYERVSTEERERLAEWKASPEYQEMRKEWIALDKSLDMGRARPKPRSVSIPALPAEEERAIIQRILAKAKK